MDGAKSFKHKIEYDNAWQNGFEVEQNQYHFKLIEWDERKSARHVRTGKANG